MTDKRKEATKQMKFCKELMDRLSKLVAENIDEEAEEAW